MDTFAKRLREARRRSGLSQEQAAVAAGMKQSDVSKLETGKSLSTTYIVELARALRCSPDWLRAGDGEPMWGESGNTSAAPATLGRVPRISWVRAGLWGDVNDVFLPGEADEWVEAYDTKPTSGAFALRVDGDSMTSPYPGERSFPDGTVIIVDPGRAANAGDYVVAKDVSSQQATFKRLVHDGGRWFLKPLNPAYPMLEIDEPEKRVIGRVIEYQMRGKL